MIPERKPMLVPQGPQWRLGWASTLMLDTRDLKSGWKRLADIPGTPRFETAGGVVGDRIMHWEECIAIAIWPCRIIAMWLIAGITI
jgi:hypothetical protein